MAIGRTELQVLWSATAYFDLATANSWVQTSDAMTQATATIKALITCKADQTTGTPASGDTVDFYAQLSLGDPDGASTAEYDTDGHDIYLGQVDLNTDDPGIFTVEFPAPVLSFKIRVDGSAGLAGGDVARISTTVLQLTA